MAAQFPTTLITREALLIAGNDATSTLRSDIDASTPTIPVELGTSSNFVVGQSIVIDSEAMRITDIPNADDLTVTRGYDGTSTAAHTAPADVRDVPLAAHHNLPVDELHAILTFLSNGWSRAMDAGNQRLENLADPRSSPAGDQDAVNLQTLLTTVQTQGSASRFKLLYLHGGI